MENARTVFSLLRETVSRPGPFAGILTGLLLLPGFALGLEFAEGPGYESLLRIDGAACGGMVAGASAESAKNCSSLGFDGSSLTERAVSQAASKVFPRYDLSLGDKDRSDPNGASFFDPAPPPVHREAAEKKRIPGWALYVGAGILGTLGGLAGGPVGMALGGVLGLSAMWLTHEKQEYGAAFGLLAGSLVGLALAGPLGGLAGAVVGGIVGWAIQKIIS